eukprot:gene10639-11585_t
MSRNLDLIVYGANGLTGRLFTEYVSRQYGNLKWAIAGKDRDSLEEVKRKLKLKNEVQLFEARADDFDRLREIVGQTKVVVNLAGPYVFTGTTIIEACLEAGTNYVDVAAELSFIRRSIDLFHREAEKKQVKIVHSCGIDAIPADLGVYLMVDEFKKKGWHIAAIRLVLEDAKGTISAGTIQSAIEAYENSSILELVSISSPFFLNPRDSKSHSPTVPTREGVGILSNSRDSYIPGFDWTLRAWTAPYFLQMIDTRIVNRSNALLNWKYGQNFIFYERMKASRPIIALFLSAVYFFFHFLAFGTITRKLLKVILPEEDRHVKQEILDHGFFKFKLIGEGTDEGGRHVSLIGTIKAENGDPGYRQTAKMAAESAISLLQEGDQLPKKFGVLTPSVAFGDKLKDRLSSRGITFDIRA